MRRRRVRVVFPSAWDRKSLVEWPASWLDAYELLISEPSDDDCPASLDVLGFVDGLVRDERGYLDGVTSSSDYPGTTVAAAIATGLGLPGSTPAAVLRAAHKLESRRCQAEAVPEATPRFAAVDPRRPPGAELAIGYPCFVKPVKGAFSIFARRAGSADELAAHLDRPEVGEFLDGFLGLFHALVGRYAAPGTDGRLFLAEELLEGRLVTVEGWVRDGEASVLGVADSIVDPATGSFVRFDLPSALPGRVQSRMADVCRRLVAALGLTETMWNVEMIWDEARDRISIIEVNPRICGQFADLHEKVGGVNGYEWALALATGAELPPLAADARGCASSFPLRVFRPTRVVRVPTAAEVRIVEETFPGTRVFVECRSGDELADFSFEDGSSHRYAVVNVGGRDRAEVDATKEAVVAALGFELAPLL